MSQPDDGGAAVVEVILDDWFVRLTWTSGLAISESAARTAMARVNDVCGPTRRPMLVDMSGSASISRAARNVFTIPCAADAIALLGNSPVDRMIANFILGASSLPTPTKYFNAEAPALAWLREHIDA